MIIPNGGGGISVGLCLNDRALASEPKEGSLVDLAGAVLRTRQDARIIALKPNERERVTSKSVSLLNHSRVSR
jgi:hypothetical protein